MYHSLSPYAGWLAVLLVCALAWLRGGACERWAVAIFIVVSVAGSVEQLLLPPDTRPIPLLITDGALAFGFMALAVRFASVWVGVAMVFQAAQFALQAYYLVDQRTPDLTFAVVNNINTLGVLAALLFGTLARWRPWKRAG